MRERLKSWIKRYFIFAGLFSLFINVFNLTFPIYMLAIYDKVLFSFSVPTLITISVGAVLATVVMAILDILRSRILILAGVHIQESLSDEVLERMIKKQASPTENPYRQGLRDLQILRNYLSGNAIFFIFDLPWMPIYLFVVYLIHPYLSAVAIAGGAISLLLGYFQSKLTSSRIELSRAMEDDLSHFQSLLFLGSETVVSMNMLPAVIKRWREKNNEFLSTLDEANKFMGLFSSITRSFRSLIPILVYGLGAYLVIESKVTVGAIIAASIITRQFLSPVDSMVATWRQTQEAKGAYKRLDRLLSEIEEKPQLKLPEPEGRVSLENVSFRIGKRQILSNINFQIEPGEAIAIIGPSGSGKTTLCRLMLGIYSPTAGRVKLDGADLSQWNREELGKYIGYLPQDVQLFEGTVAENIARLSEIDSEKVIEAAKLAGVHDMILSLPQGYDTDIGERGMRLSAGQRQRIGLARAFYGDPRFVVLDEPNSNLDEAGEKALLAAIRNLKQKKATVVIVSHRPSVLTVVDKVLVLRGGQIFMFGPTNQVIQALMAQVKQARAK